MTVLEAAAGKNIRQPRCRNQALRLTIAAVAALGALGAAHATFPGENGVIVFANYANDMIGKISPSGGAATYLTAGKQPSASPSGRKVAYVTADNTIHVIDIDGTNDVQLTQGWSDHYPTWRPDGKKLAFIRDNAGQSQLWNMNPDGTGQMFERALQGYAEGLEWAPSGLISAFAMEDPGPSIYLTAPGGSSPSLFAAKARDPHWAPEGSSIIYTQIKDINWEVREKNADGSNDHLVPLNGFVQDSVISPDGSLIAAEVWTDGFHSLVVQTFPRAGGNPVAYGVESSSDPSWSRVPKSCYETTPQGGGGVLAGDLDFYADGCAVVVMPDLGQANGVYKQVVAIGPDRRVYHRMLKRNGSAPPSWTAPTIVPGSGGTPSGIAAKKVAIAGAKDGSAQVVIVGADDVVYHSMRYRDGSWPAMGFMPLSGANGASLFKARDVAITVNASSSTSPGNAQVIANGLAAGDLYHRVRWTDGSWTAFAPVPASIGLGTRELAISAGEDGNTFVLATVTQADGAVQIKRQVRYSNSTWDSSFVNVAVTVGATLTSATDIALTLTPSPNGKAQLMYTDSSGAAWFQERSNPLSQASWTGQVSNVSVTASGSRAVSMSAQPAGASGSAEVMLVRTSPQ